MTEGIETIKRRIGKIPDLEISRVPANTIKRFKEIANKEDFCSDYGMALKFLVDFYEGIIPRGFEHLEEAVEELRYEVGLLKQKTETVPVKFVRTLSGKELRKGGKDGNVK